MPNNKYSILKIIKNVINIILTYSNLDIANKVTKRAKANIKTK